MRTVLASAADERYGFHLLNMIGSVQVNSDVFDAVVVYDLGLSPLQRRLVDAIRGVEVRTVPPFVPHWREGRTWKPWIWTHLDADRVFWLDAGATVLRSLAGALEEVRRDGYFAVGQGNPNRPSIPSDYFELYGIGDAEADQTSIAAGILGFTTSGPFFERVIRPTYDDVVRGRSLGFSAEEVATLNYGLDATDEVVLRDCPIFRHEQTLLNIHFARAVEQPRINDVYRYGGWLSPRDHPEQVIWSHRRRGDYRYLARARYDLRARPQALRLALRLRTSLWKRRNLRYFRPRAYLSKARRVLTGSQ